MKKTDNKSVLDNRKPLSLWERGDTLLQRVRGVIPSALSGLLLALAFPKYDLWWLAWVALVPFFYALNKTTDRREALLCGLSFGLVFFGIHLFWVTSLFRFAGWWVVTGWLGLALFQTIFILLFSYLMARVAPPLRVAAPLRGGEKSALRLRGGATRSGGVAWSGLVDVFVMALFWVAIEYLRGFGPFGVTAGVVGYSQADFLPIIQIASLFTVYGVSFVVVLFNAGLADVAATFRSPLKDGGLKTAATFFALPLFLIGASLVFGYAEIRHSDLNIRHFPKMALIQPNVDQFDKMNPALVMNIFELHARMTRQVATFEPEVIIWPETAVFTYMFQDRRTLPSLQALARETKAWLVIGTPFMDQGRPYNSLVSISPSGEVVSHYDKEHLVPFGEYLPFRALVYPLLAKTGYFGNDFSSGREVRLVEAAGKKIAAAVCFESTFPGLISRRVRQGGDFILTVTNDGWFGDSDAPYQHWQAGVFRAVENRRYFIQVANTGFSGLIDPYGRVVRRSRLNERATVLLNN